MSDQITSDNTKKLLLEGNGAKPRPRSPRPQQKKNADVIVENATEKRYLWTARAFAIVFAVSLCCNFILTYVIMTTMPLYRVEPYLFSFLDKNEQVYHIEPVEKVYDYKGLTELFVREYILLRNTFVNDVEEMEKRWGPGGNLQEMSSKGIYDKFRKEFADNAVELIRQHNLARNVRIKSVTEVGGGSRGSRYWQVEVRVEDMAPEYETPRVSEWQITVGIRYVTKSVKFGKRLKNPLGFTVVEYKQQVKK